MKTIVKTENEIAALAAVQLSEILAKKPDAVFGLDANADLKPFYGAAAELCKKGVISFKEAKIFVVSEFEGLDRHNAGSTHTFMEQKFFSHIDIAPENIHYPCACGESADTEKYDEEIEKAGGLDFAVLGISKNGAIGFNEPATPFDSHTHSQLLTDATKAAYAETFGGADKVPPKGVTMGIKTITSAKSVAMLAAGEEKADIIYKMIYGKTVTYVPASMLQLHLDMTLYLDGGAAAKL